MVINCRKLEKPPRKMIMGLLEYYVIPVEAVDEGMRGSIDEFFVIRLRDRNALPALEAYAASIKPTDPEFAEEVYILAARSGHFNPFCKDPD